MKTTIAAVTLSLLSAASFANIAPSAKASQGTLAQFVSASDYPYAPVFAMSTRTRAEVLAELRAAQGRGEFLIVNDDVAPRHMFVGMRDAAEVRREAALAARMNLDRRLEVGL